MKVHASDCKCKECEQFNIDPLTAKREKDGVEIEIDYWPQYNDIDITESYIGMGIAESNTISDIDVDALISMLRELGLIPVEVSEQELIEIEGLIDTAIRHYDLNTLLIAQKRLRELLRKT